MRQQLRQTTNHHLLELRLRHEHQHVAELAHKLSACAARCRHKFLLIRDHGDGAEFSLAIADRFRVGGALCAQCDAVADVLHVAAGVDWVAAVGAEYGRAHFEVAVGAVGELACRHCRF